MRSLAALFLAAATPATATTVTVANLSDRSHRLEVVRPPTDLDAELRDVVRPGAMATARKAGGKVLAAIDEADRAAFSMRYLDERGHGCHFGVIPVRHTSFMARLVPQASPVGAGRCEARTGSTIGDFVFVVR
jgi:hypothetical protein